MSLNTDVKYKALDDGSTVKIFDYDEINGVITVIDSALSTIEGAINDKIVNNTYTSGNAKVNVDNFVAVVNNSFDEILPTVASFRKKLTEIHDEYVSREAKISSALSEATSAE